MLEAARAQGIDLSNFWGASPNADGAPILQACLCVPGSGRSAMLFTSPPGDTREESILTHLVRHAADRLVGVRILQSLLEPEERTVRDALVRAGFIVVGSLSYMRRPMPRVHERAEAISLPDGMIIRPYRKDDDDELVRAMDRSYEQTLDCPELCGLRETRDVLESHRSTGRWDPSLWLLLEHRARIEGMLLLNPSPEQDSVELVYLGLSPSARGRGIGKMLMREGVSRLRGREERSIACAVDERNTPARSLYARFGFTDFARRIAMVKSLTHSA